MPTYKNTTPTALYVDGKIIEPYKTVETYKLINDDRLKKIADEPYLPLSYGIHEIETTEAGITPTEGIGISPECESIHISTDVDVDVYTNSLDNPYKFPLKKNWQLTIKANDTKGQKIVKLYLDFKDVGKVIISELSSITT